MAGLRNKMDIRSEEVQEILGTPPNWLVRWGSTLTFAIVVALGWMGYFLRYPDIVESDIRVTSTDPPKRIIAENSLNISKVWVQNEDTVYQGQILITFNTKGNFDDLLLLDKYLAEVEIVNDSTLMAFNPPRRLILGDIQQALLDFFDAQEELRRFNDNRFNQLNTQQLKNESYTIQRSIRANVNQIAKLEEELSIVNKRYDEQEKGVRELVITSRQLDLTRERMLELERERQGLEADIRTKEFQIQTIRNRINGVKQGNLQNVQNSIKKMEDRFSTLRNKLENWKNSYTVRAPIDGIALVPDESINDNQYVTKDQLLLQILPFAKGDIIGKLNLDLEGSGKVKVGQEVIVKFTSYPFREFGMVRGRINWKGRIPTNNMVPAKVYFPNGLVTTIGKDLKGDQDLVGKAEIITANKRFIEYVFERFRF